MLTAKKKQKIQKKLGELRWKNGHGKCWVCKSTSGVKAGREGYGSRCRGCINEGKTNEDVETYARLKKELEQ
jgi:hypothetical protein